MKPDIGHFLFHRMLEEMADAVYQTNQVLTALGPFVYQKLNLSQTPGPGNRPKTSSSANN